MKFRLHLKLLGFLFLTAAVPTGTSQIRLEYQGREYLLKQDPSWKQIQLITAHSMGPVQEELILKIQRKHLPPQHIHLRVSSTTPDSMIYTGILPARIQIQGGMTFELTKGSKYR